MNETIDQLIQARFDAVADPADARDWGDVLSRAGVRRRAFRPQPARLVLVAAVVAAALAATAVAFGWPGSVVDFFQAPPAPESVKAFFRGHGVALPHGLNPDTKLGEPREVMTATFDANNLPATDPTEHTLYVAPRDGGGFCFLWTEYGGSCADPLDAAAATTNPGARPFGLEYLGNDYAGFVDGYLRGDAQSVEARFADGTSVTLPVTWVSAPIDAGFFAYVVPVAHQTTSDALLSVVALDANGDVVGRDDVGVTKPLDQDVPQTLPDGTKVSLPRRAQASRATEPFSFRTASGGRAYLWIMPRTGGGSCYVFGTGGGGGGGCTSQYWLERLPDVNGGVYSNGVYFAQAKPGVARIELRFANGTSERLTPVDGYILAQLPAGARLVTTVGLDRSGKAIFTQQRKGP